MRFVKQSPGSSFAWKSEDGYYGISEDHPREFMAHHIEALWATPTELGLANTLEGAASICAEHRRRIPAPAN